MNRLQLRLGFLLILLGLLTGLTLPLLASPRLGLAAHTVGILGGLVLIALGGLSAEFMLGRRAMAVMLWSWAYAAYANWLACLIAAVTGASRLTPIAGAGTRGAPIAESIVAFLLESLAVAAIAGTGLAVWGLRGRSPGPAQEHGEGAAPNGLEGAIRRVDSQKIVAPVVSSIGELSP